MYSSMIIPLLISAGAVGMTLLYGSVRDIRERRLPHRTWRPAIMVAVPAAILVYGGILFGMEPAGLAVYASSVIVAAIGATVIDAGWWRRSDGSWPHRDEVSASFFLFLALAVPALAALISLLFPGGIQAGMLAMLSCIFAGMFYVMARLNLFGGADAYALIIIAACFPLYPLVPAGGVPVHGFFPLSVLVDSVIFVLLAPLALLIINLVRGERGPPAAMMLGIRVPGDRIQEAHGFVMEEIREEEGELHRRFIGMGEAIRRMVVSNDRIYTHNLRDDPDRYRMELAAYRRAGRVWISYGVPFLVPLTAGFFSSLFIGDFFDIVIHTLMI